VFWVKHISPNHSYLIHVKHQKLLQQGRIGASPAVLLSHAGLACHSVATVAAHSTMVTANTTTICATSPHTQQHNDIHLMSAAECNSRLVLLSVRVWCDAKIQAERRSHFAVIIVQCTARWVASHLLTNISVMCAR